MSRQLEEKRLRDEPEVVLALVSRLEAAEALLDRLVVFTDFGPGEDAEIDAMFAAWHRARSGTVLHPSPEKEPPP